MDSTRGSQKTNNFSWSRLLNSLQNKVVACYIHCVHYQPEQVAELLLLFHPLRGRFVVCQHQVVPQGFVEVDKGFSPSVFLVALGLSSSVGRVDHGQHCPFKVLFLEDPGVGRQLAAQPADLCDALGDNLVADGVKLSSLPQGSQLLIFDGDPLTFVNVKLS